MNFIVNDLTMKFINVTFIDNNAVLHDSIYYFIPHEESTFIVPGGSSNIGDSINSSHFTSNMTFILIENLTIVHDYMSLSIETYSKK